MRYFQNLKKRILPIALVLMIIPVMFAMPASVFGGTSAINRAAHAKYKQKARQLVESPIGGYYKYYDLDGDGTHELLCHVKAKTGSSWVLYVYTYKNKKLKKQLEISSYGLENITIYRKTKTILAHLQGHGYEYYEYYSLKNGKYVYQIGRGRSTNGTRPWGYWTKTKTLSRSRYIALRNKMAKGKKRSITLSIPIS